MWACDVCLYIQAATLQPQKIARCARAFSGNPAGAPPIQAHVATTEPTEKHGKQQGSQKVSQNFLGRGDGTEQPGRIAKANRPGSAVYGDEERCVRANPLANRPAHTAARFPIFFPRFSSLSASSLSFLCSLAPCIRPRPSSRRSPRG